MKFNRQRLIEVLTENRAKHRKEYDEAVEEYWQAVRRKLDKIMVKYKNRENVGYVVTMPRPSTSHEKDYDRVLQMLQMAVETEVSLSEKDFARYILDDWEWKDDFNTTKGSYK
jgi:hypothetical protein